MRKNALTENAMAVESVLAQRNLRMTTIEGMYVEAPVLELADATVVKDGRRVLDQLNLTIRQGEHTAIIGPNGAGKSILVSLLTQEQRPIAPVNGTPPVRVFGRQNWDLFELRSQLGIISADLHQHFVSGNSEGSITAEAAVLSAFLSSYGILRYGTISDSMRSRAAAALDAAGASQLAGRTLDEMSSGEARRVLLARALATSPRALVLDEPTTGLDLAARHSFMETVRHLARGGTTVVLITHHIEEIFPEIGRVILLRDGRIVADGPAAVNLTDAKLTKLFECPVAVEMSNGYHYTRPTGASNRA
jgi:iron complex transport system ATP-binding protein